MRQDRVRYVGIGDKGSEWPERGGLLMGCCAGRDVVVLAGSFCHGDGMAGFCAEACVWLSVK